MCGFIISNFKVPNYKINSLSKILNHRGPDDKNFYKYKDINFFFNRLSIIDLKKRSNQPFKYKNYILTFNGEIFNYIEIKKELEKSKFFFKTQSDTEVLLYSFIKWGEKCLNKLEGMFSFCIYNKLTNEFFLARDAFGIKPLFYCIDNNNFVFSSEKKAIFGFFIEKKLNKNSLSNYLSKGIYQNNEYTFYKNILSLNPGCYLKFSNKKKYIYKWYNIKPEINKNLNYQDLKEQMNQYLNESVKLCLRSDKDLSLALSGGTDSQILLEKICKLNQDALKTTIHWNCENYYLDKKISEIIVANLKNKIFISEFKKKDFFKYFIKAITHIEEPVGGLNYLSALKMFEKMNRMKLRVIIDGTGSDEIFGGYGHHLNSYINKVNYKYLPVQGLSINYNNKILSKNLINRVPEFQFEKKFNDHLKDAMWNDLIGSKLRRSLNQLDHLTMSNSIEARFPYLNKRLINFCYGISNEFLINKRNQKYILRDSSYMRFIYQKKRVQQTPQTKWVKEFILDKFIHELKMDNYFFDIDLFNKKELFKYLRNWKQNNQSNSVLPWYIMNSYYLIKYVIYKNMY